MHIQSLHTSSIWKLKQSDYDNDVTFSQQAQKLILSNWRWAYQFLSFLTENDVIVTIHTIKSKFTLNCFSNCLEMRRVACGFTVALKLFLFYYWSVSFFIGQYNLEMILPWIGFDLNSFEISKISKKKKNSSFGPSIQFHSLNRIRRDSILKRRTKKLTGSRECIEQFEPFQFQPERTCTSTWENPVFKPKLLSLTPVRVKQRWKTVLFIENATCFDFYAMFSSYFLR